MNSVCADLLASITCLVLEAMASFGGNTILRRFKVLRKLGAGCFGSVFEVQDTANVTDGTLACKEIPRTTEGITDFEHVCHQINSLRLSHTQVYRT